MVQIWLILDIIDLTINLLVIHLHSLIMDINQFALNPWVIVVSPLDLNLLITDTNTLYFNRFKSIVN